MVEANESRNSGQRWGRAGAHGMVGAWFGKSRLGQGWGSVTVTVRA